MVPSAYFHVIVFDIPDNWSIYMPIVKRKVMEHICRRILIFLKSEGFELVAVRGSHHKFRKGALTVVVPHPRKDIAPGTARQIAKQAGWL